ncbi:hypothetical protein Chor_009710 [Crotalus horridus]
MGDAESKMPHIDNDIKLDFKDVLLRPKRSTLKSRSEVDLLRFFTFRNSKQTYRGIPIIAANMDTVGTFEMAKVLGKNVAASTGTSDLEHLERVLESVPQIRYICLDVANGYSEHFVQFLRDLRKRYPDHTIMVRRERRDGRNGGGTHFVRRRHHQSGDRTRASEGKVVEVPFKGDVEHTLRDILGGIRSTCTYVGAAKLKELSRRTTFIRVTQQVNPIFGGEDQP